MGGRGGGGRAQQGDAGQGQHHEGQWHRNAQAQSKSKTRLLVQSWLRSDNHLVLFLCTSIDEVNSVSGQTESLPVAVRLQKLFCDRSTGTYIYFDVRLSCAHYEHTGTCFQNTLLDFCLS